MTCDLPVMSTGVSSKPSLHYSPVYSYSLDGNSIASLALLKLIRDLPVI